MIRENRSDLAGLSGMKVQVYYDPDDLTAGAWAMDPRSGQSIYLSPENRINPFNAESVSEQLAEKRSNMKAVSGTFRETAAIAGKVLTSSEYKPFIESKAAAQKAIADKTAAAAAMTDDDFNAAVAVASRLVKEQGERAKRQPVYPTKMKRYEAILDVILRGGELSPQDRLFKVDYENRMGEEEKNHWDVYIKFNQGENYGSD
jgi:putative transposase